MQVENLRIEWNYHFIYHHFSFITKTVSILNPNKNMVCFRLQPPVSAIFFA